MACCFLNGTVKFTKFPKNNKLNVHDDPLTIHEETPIAFFIERHYKDAFDRITKDKQRRILDAANEDAA